MTSKKNRRSYGRCAYSRFCRKLSRARPSVLNGKVDEEFGAATLNLEWEGFLEEEQPLGCVQEIAAFRSCSRIVGRKPSLMADYVQHAVFKINQKLKNNH